MTLCGIVAEYNPLHCGHIYHMEQARARSGCQYVAAVLSGSFVQRGDVACADKWTRARWALCAGADVVFELPTAYVLQSAEQFAAGGVAVLSATGMLTALSFGSERAETEALQRAASALDTPAFQALLRAELAAGRGYPAACRSAFAALLPELGEAAGAPNFLLGASYLRALQRLCPQARALPVLRVGEGHESQKNAGRYSSATAFRTALQERDEALLAQLPPFVRQSFTGREPAGLQRLSQALLYRLRTASDGELFSLCGAEEGLQNRLRLAGDQTDAASCLGALRTRRYTDARLRRLLCAALVGFTKDLQRAANAAPPYLRVLGIRKESRALLGELKKACTVPLLCRAADMKALSGAAAGLCALDHRAADIAALAQSPVFPAGRDYTEPLVVV